jgi:hypothetical protein
MRLAPRPNVAVVAAAVAEAEVAVAEEVVSAAAGETTKQLLAQRSR